MKVKKTKAKSDFPHSQPRKIVRVDDEIEVVVRELPNGLDGIDSLSSSLKLIDRYDPNWLDKRTSFILAGNKEFFKKKSSVKFTDSYKRNALSSVKNSNSCAHDEIHTSLTIGHIANTCSRHMHKAVSQTQSESNIFEENLYFNIKEIKNSENTISKNKMNVNNVTHFCEPSLSSNMNVSCEMNNQRPCETLPKQKSPEALHKRDSSSSSDFLCTSVSDVESSLPSQKVISPESFNFWDNTKQCNFSPTHNEQGAVSSKLHWMRFDQRSEKFFSGGEMSEQEEVSCRMPQLQVAQQLPCPSEAETAPNTGNDMFLDGVFSKIQHNFEQKNPLHCWLSSEKFEALSVQSLRESIQSKIAKTVITENVNELKSGSHSNFGNLKAEFFKQVSAMKQGVSDTSKRKTKRKDELALLYDALKEISWAQNLSPKNLFAKYKSRRKHSNKLGCNFSTDQTKKLNTLSLLDSSKHQMLKGKSKLLNKKMMKKQPSEKGTLEVTSKSEFQTQHPAYSTKNRSSQKKGKAYVDHQKIMQHSEKSTGKVVKCMKKQMFPTTNILKKYMKRNIKSVENKVELLNVINSASHVKNVAHRNAYNTLSIHDCHGHKNPKLLNQKLSQTKSYGCRKGLQSKDSCQVGVDHCYSQCLLTNSDTFYNQNGCDVEKNSDFIEMGHIPQQNELRNWNLSDESVHKSPELRVTLEPLEYTDVWFRNDSSDETRKVKTRQSISHREKILCQTSLEDQNHVASVLREVQGSIMDAFSSIKPSKKRRYEEETVRFSVRQSECAFRYKEIVVKKHQNYIQVVLVPNSGKQNSLTVEALKELREALQSARKDPNCKVLLLNSSGSFFCSGLDLCPLLGSSRKHAAEEIAGALKDLMQSLGTFPKPVVAAVNGATLGLGVALLTLCDVVLASDKATFCIPSTKLGYIPEGAATLTLPQVVGATVATKMLLQGSKLTAQQALRHGLVSEVIWPTQLMEEVVPRVQALASQPLQVMEATKTMVRCHLWEKLQTTLEREARILPKQWMSPTCQKALQLALQNGCLSDF